MASLFSASEKGQAYKEWWQSGCYCFTPYIWRKEYENSRREVQGEVDAENGLPYVMHNGKRLYFRKGGPSALEKAKLYYRGLLIEQDERSAHRYVRSYEELKGKVLLDIGSAEAIFTLTTIEYVDHAYIFECEEEWIEALQATFAPWKEKVTIVRKYVSDTDDDDSVSLDEFFKDKPSENLFLKMDIEGYERKALKGAERLLKNSKQISGSVCLYHKHDDEAVLMPLLSSYGMQTEVQPGYVFIEGELRRAIVRFWK